ncbi:MAG: hypothetical protein R2744_13750, partial [Bacteroidales bacterium]
MGKIKKIYKYPLLLLATLFLLTGIAFIALKSPKVQTRLASYLLNRVSENIRGNISFSDLRFTFFNRVSINNILILDETADTLIYSDLLNIGLRKIDRKSRALRIGRIYAENPVIGIRSDSSGE